MHPILEERLARAGRTRDQRLHIHGSDRVGREKVSEIALPELPLGWAQVDALADPAGAILDRGFDAVDGIGRQHKTDVLVRTETIHLVEELAENRCLGVDIAHREHEVDVFEDHERRL